MWPRSNLVVVSYALLLGFLGCGGKTNSSQQTNLLQQTNLPQQTVSGHIVVYGQNDADWNHMLGTSVTRGTCSATPDVCINSVTALLKGQNTNTFYLNMVPDPNTVASYALQYSTLSLQEPRLQQIGLDDFLSYFADWCYVPNLSCDALLQQVIDNTKAKNPALKFGITLYVDEVSTLSQNQHLTPRLRAQIDAVHLYVQYREQGPQFDQYVQQVAAAFPNATIVAGAYPVDRITYLNCSPSGAPCTTEQELDLFKQTLSIQVRLMRQGQVSGIEFYPGYFGWEDKWPGWKDPRICAPERVQSCIDNTRLMHEATLQILDTK